MTEKQKEIGNSTTATTKLATNLATTVDPKFINHEDVFAKLTDMFGEVVTSDIVNDVCIKHNWQIENCIEGLIGHIENLQKCEIGKNPIEMNYQDNLEEDDVVIESEEISTVPVSVIDNEIQNLPSSSLDQKNLGAIPKTTSTVGSISTSASSAFRNFSEILQQDSREFVDTTTATNSATAASKQNYRKRHNATTLPEVQNIIDKIRTGYKVMIIMRGPPGCGKSYLAQYIVNQTTGNDYRNHIFSSDDYFYNVHDEYIYNRDKLQEAHEFNQKRVRKRTTEGWSPIIVDNTNIKIWEMSPYAQYAVQNGYLLEILCPENDWCNSASKLSMKNKHNVPKDKIEIMMRNFEPCTVNDLMKIFNLRYNVPTPLYRHQPPLKPEIFKKDTKILGEEEMITSNDDNQSTTNLGEHFFPIKSTLGQSDFVMNQPFLDSPKILTLENINPPKIPHIWTTSTDNINKNNSIQKSDNNQSVNYENWSESINDNISNISTIDHLQWKAYDEIDDKINLKNLPKPARNNSKRIQQKRVELNDNDDILEEEIVNIPKLYGDWKSYEEESNEFWNTNGKTKQKTVTSDVPKPKRNLSKTTAIATTTNFNSNLFSLLKEKDESNYDENDSVNDQNKDKMDDLSSNKLEKHCLNCPNESKSFLMLRQIYQNKQLDGLWDLFEKCNGDVNWAIDILLKDDSCVITQLSNEMNVNNYFKCNCDENMERPLLKSENNQDKESSPPEKIPRCKVKKEKSASGLSNEMLEAKRAIEKQIAIADEYYSENVKKIRNFRHGIETNNQNDDVLLHDINSFQPEEQEQEQMNFHNIERMDNNENDNENDNDNDNDNEPEDMIEISLGERLIRQLESMFNAESNLCNTLKNFKTNVFMPKNLAKQLYALWMESLYNQIEEQKQTAIKEDEDFARFLQNPSIEQKHQLKPKTFKEIMDMDLAWSFYKSSTNKNWKDHMPNDLASHLTRMKLFETFPNVDKETILEILNAHQNNFSDTVEVLQDSLKINIDEDIRQKEINLLKQAKDEIEMDKTKANENLSGQPIMTTNAKDFKNLPSPEHKMDALEIKRLALQDFEECRNLAAHHSQLKAECYRKARDSIQKGNHSVAVYYSQIANLHKSKIEKYNHKAASCIMEIQISTQSDPDLIDLHYLHVLEAVECLDVFIDSHITKLRNISKNFKFIFVITGRGLHSAGGISAIKNRVKQRLKDRNLTWSEVNPGLLKVKIYCTSKYSKNL